MNTEYIDKIKKIKKVLKEIENKLYDEEDPEEITYLKKEMKKYKTILASHV